MCHVNRSYTAQEAQSAGKAFDCVSWTLLGEYEALRLPAMYRRSLRAVFMFLVKVALFLCGCLTLPSSFLATNPCCILMNRIFRSSKGVERAHFGDHKIATLFFADAVILLTSSDHVLERRPGQFESQYDVAKIRGQ